MYHTCQPPRIRLLESPCLVTKVFLPGKDFQVTRTIQNWVEPTEKIPYWKHLRICQMQKTKGKIREKELLGNSPKASKASELVSLLPGWQVAKKARGTNRWLSAKMEAKLFNCYLANNLIWRLAKTCLGMLPILTMATKSRCVWYDNSFVSGSGGSLPLFSIKIRHYGFIHIF